ncbi:ABC transporter substrate-binding protein [Salinicola rhizosphaerae]|uniref:SsuA/THI5-like domain-containing protein n=1 Tax=Salinicola rhizosphaerae TaxID=1443141 RepID=A0ABQ3DXR1_9GAMM|nr:ABC transporter substrate-binding protein [Salinicola rhizosphaerae]GHB18328.1 hypothetical protein GCM10009038_16700 [Salinicola rhizosphaerae]
MISLNARCRSRLSAALFAPLCLVVAGAAFAQTLSADTLPESGDFRVGVEPWLGYGQWYVAEDQGFLEENGLDSVDIVNFAEDKDINAALVSGDLDAASVALHTAMAMKSSGVPIHIVTLLDVSEHADAMIANADITSLNDLAGKKIAYEEGTTSDILLRDALKSAGMSIDDIQPVPMPASSAGSSLIAGRVPVAVTYEPYLSAAKANGNGLHVLYDGSDNPGLISDVLVVRDEVIDSRPGQVLAMVKSWDHAVEHYRAHRKDDQALIASAIGADATSLETAFDGVRYYTLADTAAALDGEFLSKTFSNVLEAATQAGFVQGDISADDLIDTRFVDALGTQ